MLPKDTQELIEGTVGQLDRINSGLLRISSNIEEVGLTMANLSRITENSPFWESNIFAAIIGFGGGLTVFLLGLLGRFWSSRKKTLNRLYYELGNEFAFYRPESLINQVRSMRYGGVITTADGSVENRDKSVSEKVLIEFKKGIKHQTFPRLSRIKWMYKKYERKLAKLPNLLSKRGTSSPFLEDAELYYEKIKTFVYKKTGEDEWTIR